MRALMMRICALALLVLLSMATAFSQKSNRNDAEQWAQVTDFLQTFYKHGEVNKVAPMLQRVMKLKLPDESGSSREPIIYFFARLAELHPDLLRQYEGLFDKADAQQRDLLIQVLKACGDAQTAQMLKAKLDGGKAGANGDAIKAVLADGIPKKFDLNQPAVTATDLDVRWMEFFITGNAKDVGRIADAINRTEIVRMRVLQWLDDPRSAQKAPEVAKKAQRMIGLRIDTENRQVLNLDDTDLLLMDRENRMGKARFDALRAAVPIELTRDDYIRIAVKGSALWSLSSNAEQHAPVKKFLEMMHDDPRPRVRLACLRALAFAEFAREDYRAAQTHADEYLQQTDNRDVAILRMEANYELELTENAALQTAANAIRIDGAASARAHEAWVNSLESAKAMAAQTVIWDDKDNMAVRWLTLYQAPDRYDVLQTAWEGKNRQVIFDKWRYLGTEQFSNFGFWVSGVPDQAQRATLNPALRGADILTALKAQKPNTASRWMRNKQAVVLLEYSPGTVHLLRKEIAPTSCKVWMDESTGRVLKIELSYVMTEKKEKLPARITQVFGGVNADINLERPPDVMDLSDAKKEVRTK